MQTLKRILIITLASIGLLLGLTLTYTFVFKDEITQQVVESLNKNLKTKIEVQEVNFSIFSDFPNASVEFRNVLAWSPDQFWGLKYEGFEADTLFYFGQFNLHLNLIDLIQSKYTIRSASANNGLVNLIRTRNDYNYDFWEQKPESSNNNVDLKLNNLLLESTEIRYIDQSSKTLIHSFPESFQLKGQIENGIYQLNWLATQDIRLLRLNGNVFLEQTKIKNELALAYFENYLEIESGNIQVEGSDLQSSGHIDFSAKELDLKLHAKEVKPGLLLAAIPRNYKKNLKIQGRKARLNADISFRGNYKKKKVAIRSTFEISKSDLKLKYSGETIHIKKCKGTYTNGKACSKRSSLLHVNQLSLKKDDSWFTGAFAISNFSRPWVRLNGSTELHLIDFSKWLQKSLDISTGVIKGDFLTKGSILNFNRIEKYLPRLHYEGDFDLRKLNLKLKKHGFQYENINGSFQVNDGIYFDKLSLLLNENPIEISGSTNEFWKPKRKIRLQASVQSEQFVLEKLLFTLPENSKEKKLAILFPNNMEFKLKLNVNNFSFKEFKAQNVKGELDYRPRMLTLHKLILNTMNGKISGGGAIIQKYKNDFALRIQSDLKHINIQELFASTQNFGQKVLRSEHLRGQLNGDVNLKARLLPDLSFVLPEINMNSNIKIKDGELINFEPLQEVSGFIRLDDLKHIRFSELENSISIRNQKISIPQMKIESSAMNMLASGSHFFSNYFDYRLQLSLSELLWRKTKRKEKQSKFGKIKEEEQDTRKLFLRIKGNVNDFDVSYDSQAARDNMKKKLRKERETLRSIFREEFGRKKDTNKKQFNSTQFQIEWDEQEKKKKKKKEEAQNIQTKKEFIIEWEEDTIR